jgi:hypothetical protein
MNLFKLHAAENFYIFSYCPSKGDVTFKITIGSKFNSDVFQIQW